MKLNGNIVDWKQDDNDDDVMSKKKKSKKGMTPKKEKQLKLSLSRPVPIKPKRHINEKKVTGLSFFSEKTKLCYYLKEKQKTKEKID